MGRPPKLTKHQQREVLACLARGEERLTEKRAPMPSAI
jgi:hypothetical protein